MKKLKTIVAGFLLFNCISVAAILACDQTMTVNGETCSYTGTYNGYCWYSCPSGAGGFKPVKGGEFEPEGGGDFRITETREVCVHFPGLYNI